MLDQICAIRPKELRQLRREQIVQVMVANQKPLVDEAYAQLDVGLIELAALGNSANGLAKAQSAIPHRSEKGGQGLSLCVALYFLVYEKEQVDIGVRKQLTPAVSSHGEDGHAVGEGRRKVASKCMGHELVDKRASTKNGGSRVTAREELAPYRLWVRVLILHDLHYGYG